MPKPQVEQYTATTAMIYPPVRLIPPLSDDFAVYGGEETVERAREWALRYHYLLTDGLPNCAHGFYGMSMCPAVGCGPDDFDHVNMWVPATHRDGAPFLLSHSYLDGPIPALAGYADAHALRVDVNWPDDRWYGHGTSSIRLTLQGTDYALWPIETYRMTLLATQPVRWPDADVMAPGWGS